MPWYREVLLDASRLREVNRTAKALLVNHKAKRGNAEEERGGERERERESVEKEFVVIASEQSAHCFFVWFFFCLLFPIIYFAALIYLHLGLLCS